MNNKGQSILSEYVMIFFVVIAAAVAMTTFVQRSFEGRVHDARNYMVDAVVQSGACDENCVKAAGGKISHEYEPYYAQMVSDVNQNQATSAKQTTGNAQVIGAIYSKDLNQTTKTISTSYQLPPQCANGGC